MAEYVTRWQEQSFSSHLTTSLIIQSRALARASRTQENELHGELGYLNVRPQVLSQAGGAKSASVRARTGPLPLC